MEKYIIMYTLDKNKKRTDGLMNPDDLYMKTLLKGGLKKPKNDLFEKVEDDLITNDGRKLLKEI